MEFNLSARLCKLCEMTPACDSLVDVGCDHGYVSMELVRSGRVRRVLAVDVNEGPLERARENIGRAGLSGVIETRLSNGLHNIEAGRSFDTILIAGMGGRLMRDILTEGSRIVREASFLVLQPQSEIFLVREFLGNNGFSLQSEACIRDREKYYFILVCARDAGCKREEEEFFLEYSRFLLAKKCPVYREYLIKSKETVERYLKQAGDRSEKLLRDSDDLSRALSFYENR